MRAYPAAWIELLDSKSDKELHQIDGKNNPVSLSGTEVGQFIKEIQELISWPKEKIEPVKLPAWAYKKVKEKKQHEIDCLREIIIPLKEKIGFRRMADIGGGVGNLSRIMAHYHGLPSTCLDMNEDFIKKGIKRTHKYPKPSGAAELSFEKFYFGQENREIIKKYFSNDTITLGLHTCGPLALEHINEFQENNALAMLNFGCCYSKLEPIKQTNISSFAKENPLNYSLHALTLATRSHSSMTFENFKLKERVKSYRYSLELFLKEHLGLKDFNSLGEAHPRVYWGSFSSYALLKLEGLNLDSLPEREELEKFYQNKDIIKKVRFMFLANIIRWQLGRAIELSILLDRCIYLQEKSRKTKLLQVFDEELSPRNLGILSY